MQRDFFLVYPFKEKALSRLCGFPIELYMYMRVRKNVQDATSFFLVYAFKEKALSRLYGFPIELYVYMRVRKNVQDATRFFLKPSLYVLLLLYTLPLHRQGHDGICPCQALHELLHPIDGMCRGKSHQPI